MRIRKYLAATVVLVSAAAGVALTGAPASAAVEPNTNNTKIDFGRRNVVPWENITLPDGTTCPGGVVTLEGPVGGTWGKGQWNRLEYTTVEGDIADVTGDGFPDQVVRYGCTVAGTDTGFHYYYLYSFYKAPYGPGLSAIRETFITSSSASETNSGQWNVTHVTPVAGAIKVGQTVDTNPGQVEERVFRPSPTGLVPDRPLPTYPQADTEPARHN
ncbi:hypothetical protein [Cryptosporangium arvum]|uniref:hypothetical protein n=1 Tax=Cryptosporangium arvum TaxID=80871 RepID=UPI0004B06E04|nr:hypothetical protein [Cryptosporangium arvum]